MVIAFVWLPAAMAAVGVGFAGDLVLRVALLGVIAALFALAYAVEAFVRRCPSCRRLLAGMPTGRTHTGSHVESVSVTTAAGPQRADRTVDSYDTLWRCVHCKHRWES